MVYGGPDYKGFLVVVLHTANDAIVVGCRHSYLLQFVTTCNYPVVWSQGLRYTYNQPLNLSVSQYTVFCLLTTNHLLANPSTVKGW